jgi:hypothetical protein
LQSPNAFHSSFLLSIRQPKRSCSGRKNVRLYLQRFHRKAGFHGDPYRSFIAGRRVSPSWLRTSVRQVRAHGALHGKK